MVSGPLYSLLLRIDRSKLWLVSNLGVFSGPMGETSENLQSMFTLQTPGTLLQAWQMCRKCAAGCTLNPFSVCQGPHVQVRRVPQARWVLQVENTA